MSDASVIYLSGPISLGGQSSELEKTQFTAKFYAYEDMLKSKAWVKEVINPCDCEEQDSWEDYMKIHIPSVCRADVVACLPQFYLSRGSLLEVFLANQLKIEVVMAPDLVMRGRA